MADDTIFTASDPPFDAARLFALMERSDADLLLVSSRHNTRYLTGGYFYPLFMWDSHTRRTQHLSFLGIVPGSLEKAFFVGRPGEASVMAEADIWVEPRVDSPEIGIASTVPTVAGEIRARGLDRGRIAVELTSMPASGLQALQRELPHAEFVEAAAILDSLRAVKSQRELRIIRDGALRNLEGVEAALRSGAPGQTTADVAGRVEEEFQARGLHFLYSLVCAGPHYFRAASAKRIWEAGRPLHIDAGALLDGYVVEVCRMGHLGSPSALADELLRFCCELRDHVLELFRPGTPVREVQSHANAFLAGGTYGELGKFIAHGIGLVHHEDPIVSLKSDHVLEAGMVLSIEMEYRLPDVGHVKVEELVVITDEGFEVITPRGDQWTRAGI